MQYFYDKQMRRYIQQFIRLFSGFSVEMGTNQDGTKIYQTVPVRYGDVSRMAAHIVKDNSENVVNATPFISCYVSDMGIAPERRTHAQHSNKVQVYEKKYDNDTNAYLDELGDSYQITRYQPVPYNLTMQVDIWTSNTEQKLQMLEQILVLFNPTLDIRTSNNAYDWSSLSYVEMKNTNWSSRSIGSSIDDIIDVASFTFDMPILINPPAKVKQQKLIHTVINQMYSLDEADLDNFKENLAFNKASVEYTVVTFEDRKVKFEDNKLTLLSANETTTDALGNAVTWTNDLKTYGELRDGISQIRLRKNSDPGDSNNDIIGRLYADTDTTLTVAIDQTTLPTNTVSAINGIVNGMVNYPGDGTVPAAVTGQRYLLLHAIPVSSNWNGLSTADRYDIVEYNGSAWTVSFDASVNAANTHYVNNISSQDQLEWNGTTWVNSYEAIYNAGFWRLYL